MLLGYDIGSSSIKAALVHAETGQPIASVQFPNHEMPITAPQTGWAEQSPEMWWHALCRATKLLLRQTGIAPQNIHGIGISYQMHGLVLVDAQFQPLRPAIIWCDSRAVEIGNRAFHEIGEAYCLQHLLNSPANFTAAKLGWVRENEPHIFEKIAKIMLPGDYIAARLTGDILTTPSGLSEGIFWDFSTNSLSDAVLAHFQLDKKIFPSVVPTFSHQGVLSKSAAAATGLRSGIPITYRAGDQPNNALSLGALHAGEVAATGGTSGVVYAVTEHPLADEQQRVNSFAHVNHSAEQPSIGVLLCINGAGSAYSWVRRQFASLKTSYSEMEKIAATAPTGADGLLMLPFGNGAERMFHNRDLGAQLLHLNFNRHEKSHIFRATLEGIAFGFVQGIHIFREMGIEISALRVGNDNLFQSQIFASTVAALTQCPIELIATTGAVGAAQGAGVAAGFFDSPAEAVRQRKILSTYSPTPPTTACQDAFAKWQLAAKNAADWMQ